MLLHSAETRVKYTAVDRTHALSVPRHKYKLTASLNEQCGQSPSVALSTRGALLMLKHHKTMIGVTSAGEGGLNVLASA